MTDRLESLVNDCVSALGLDVEAVELNAGGRRRVLRIALDADGGIGIDHITDLPRHWRRNTGRLVRVALDDDTILDGRIGASDDIGVELTTKKDATHVAYDQIVTALVQTELNRKDA